MTEAHGRAGLVALLSTGAAGAVGVHLALGQELHITEVRPDSPPVRVHTIHRGERRERREKTQKRGQKRTERGSIHPLEPILFSIVFFLLFSALSAFSAVIFFLHLQFPRLPTRPGEHAVGLGVVELMRLR